MAPSRGPVPATQEAADPFPSGDVRVAVVPVRGGLVRVGHGEDLVVGVQVADQGGAGEALAAVEALPEKHPGFVANHEKNMAQYWKENPRAGRGRARPGDLKGVTVPGKGQEDECADGAVSRVA